MTVASICGTWCVRLHLFFGNVRPCQVIQVLNIWGLHCPQAENSGGRGWRFDFCIIFVVVLVVVVVIVGSMNHKPQGHVNPRSTCTAILLICDIFNVQCSPCLWIDWVNIYPQVCALGQCQDDFR